MLYILLGIVALLALLVSVPVVLRVTWDGEDFRLGLRYLFISYSIYPREDKEPGRLRAYFDGVLERLKKKRAEKKPRPAVQKPKKSAWQSLVERKGFFGAIGYYLRVAFKSADLGAYLLRHSVISRMKIHITVGGDDAADIAVRQGQWCAGLYPALSLVLCSVKRYRNCSVNITPDFLSEENKYDIDARLRVKPFRGIVGAVRMLVSLTKAEIGDRPASYSLDAFEKAAHSGENKPE